ncbi:MAG TPA: toll/interleukin-1 receptor domain-containing protein [Bryobacteraceae bacterium]|nr:toll/interleukin-1 receptor domain-containing protein [Bryobacteraceae bacterium]
MNTVFFSYSHKDESLRDELEVHLSLLKRQGVISVWHDRRLGAGNELNAGISRELERADIILLLVSPDFLASDYCYSVERTRALERHDKGEARVIPVILRPCDWHHAPFGKLLALPRDGKPVTRWTDRDEAFLNVINAIRTVLQPAGPSTAAARPVGNPADTRDASSREPRSSNLRLRKIFTDHDRDLFLEEAFQFMMRFSKTLWRS